MERFLVGAAEPQDPNAALIADLRAQVATLQADKAELERKLQRYYDGNKPSQKRWYDANRDKILAQQKQYRDEKRKARTETLQSQTIDSFKNANN